MTKHSHAAVASTILETLKSSGHRMTKTRAAMLEIFSAERRPYSVQELLAKLSERGLKKNKTTVYRELEFLIKERLAREVDLLDGKKRYELVVSGDHHHHLICESCDTVQCVDLHHDLDHLEHELEKAHHFTITHHSLEFFGVCQNCAKSEKVHRVRRAH